MNSPILGYYQQLRMDISVRVKLIMSEEAMRVVDLVHKVGDKTHLSYSLAERIISNVLSRDVPAHFPYWYTDGQPGDLIGLAKVLFTLELSEDDLLIERIGEDYNIFVYPPPIG